MSKPFTSEMRLFLLELADLMEKHEVTIAAVEETRSYHTSATGIEFSQTGKYEGEAQRDYCCVETTMGTIEMNDRDVRIFANQL